MSSHHDRSRLLSWLDNEAGAQVRIFRAVILCPSCQLSEVNNLDAAAEEKAVRATMLIAKKSGKKFSEAEVRRAVQNAILNAYLDCPECTQVRAGE